MLRTKYTHTHMQREGIERERESEREPNALKTTVVKFRVCVSLPFDHLTITENQY